MVWKRCACRLAKTADLRHEIAKIGTCQLELRWCTGNDPIQAPFGVIRHVRVGARWEFRKVDADIDVEDPRFLPRVPAAPLDIDQLHMTALGPAEGRASLRESRCLEAFRMELGSEFGAEIANRHAYLQKALRGRLG